MYAGQMRTRIRIVHRTAGEDDWGKPLEVWAVLTAVYADFRVLGGLESIKANAETAVVKASARIRFRADVTNGMRVDNDGQIWEIKAVLPDVKHRRFVDLSLEMVA